MVVSVDIIEFVVVIVAAYKGTWIGMDFLVPSVRNGYQKLIS